MAIEIEVRRFTGGFARFNSPRTRYPVGIPEVVNKAITVGGRVAGSAQERTWRRSAIGNLVLSAVRHVGALTPGADLRTTDLYRRTETTEKAGISFRLGMAFAASATSRTNGLVVLRHIPHAGGGGRRADLIGADRGLQRHVVEAKSRTYGFNSSLISEAKQQAGSLVPTGFGPIATRSACLADLSQSPIYVLIEDPPPDSQEERPVFEVQVDEQQFFAEYYSPVTDLLDLQDPEPSGEPSVDQVAEGAWLPGGAVWLGLARTVLNSGRETGDWISAIERHDPRWTSLAGPETRTHASADGHVVVLAPEAIELLE